MDNKSLKKYIELLIEQVLYEEETPPEPSDNAGDNEAGLDLGGGDTPDNEAEGLDLGSTGDVDPAGNETSDASVDVGTDTEAETGMTDVDSSGGGFGGFSGGGGGFDFSTDSTEDNTTDSGSGVESTEPTPTQTIPEDPVQDTVKLATDLSSKIGDTQQIVNAVKSNIQKYFEDPGDSVEVVQQLWNSEDPKLRLVAVKLLMFIRGG